MGAGSVPCGDCRCGLAEDADCGIHFNFVHNEWWAHAHAAVATGQHEESALKRFYLNLTSDVAIGEVDADHEADAANVGDMLVAGEASAQPLDCLCAAVNRVLHQVLIANHFEGGNGSCRGDWVATER